MPTVAVARLLPHIHRLIIKRHGERGVFYTWRQCYSLCRRMGQKQFILAHSIQAELRISIHRFVKVVVHPLYRRNIHSPLLHTQPRTFRFHSSPGNGIFVYGLCNNNVNHTLGQIEIDNQVNRLVDGDSISSPFVTEDCLIVHEPELENKTHNFNWNTRRADLFISRVDVLTFPPPPPPEPHKFKLSSGAIGGIVVGGLVVLGLALLVLVTCLKKRRKQHVLKMIPTSTLPPPSTLPLYPQAGMEPDSSAENASNGTPALVTQPRTRYTAYSPYRPVRGI